VNLRNLQNLPHYLAGVRIKVRVWVRITVRVKARFSSEICKLHMHDLETVQHILQTAQTDKSHETVLRTFGANAISTLQWY